MAALNSCRGSAAGLLFAIVGWKGVGEVKRRKFRGGTVLFLGEPNPLRAPKCRLGEEGTRLDQLH